MSSEIHPPISSPAIVMTEVTAMGGAERSCFALARWLYEHGIESHFVTYIDKVRLEEFANHPLQVVQLRPEMNPLGKVLAMRRYFAARSGGPKPLMSGYQPALHASLGGLRGFHCLMHDTPSLFSDAGTAKPLKSRLGRWVSDKATAHGLKSGGRTIVTSEYLKKETRKVFGVEADIVRMGGVMSQATAFKLRPVNGTLRILSVSRIEANKRIDWMIRSLAELERAETPLCSRVDWRLDVVGKGSELEKMRGLSSQSGLANRVHFHGFVNDDELEKLYSEASLFLMPASQGYGIPAIEALSRGIPVLLHRESGVSDILLETPWAVVMEGGEDALGPALTKTIDQLLRGAHLSVPLPKIPTEATWAAEVARLCHWV